MNLRLPWSIDPKRHWIVLDADGQPIFSVDGDCTTHEEDGAIALAIVERMNDDLPWCTSERRAELEAENAACMADGYRGTIRSAKHLAPGVADALERVTGIGNIAPKMVFLIEKLSISGDWNASPDVYETSDAAWAHAQPGDRVATRRRP